MYTYLIIDLLIILFPLLFSFENKIKFYKNFAELFISISSVGIPLIIWDYYANLNGVWGFSENYTTGIRILGLPIEEIAFFLVVPYSMIFLWETYNYYIQSGRIGFSKNIFVFLASLSLLIAVINFGKNYTFTVFLFLTIIFFISYLTNFGFINSTSKLLFFILSFIPFLLVNYLLTSIPVVTYNPDHYSNINIITIPLEDFFYSFLLVYSYIFVYEIAKQGN